MASTFSLNRKSMALKCITISNSKEHNPLILRFLSRARFLEEVSVLPSLKAAERKFKDQHIAYIMLDLTSCPAEVAEFQKAAFPNTRLILFSQNDVFSLEPLPEDLHHSLFENEPTIVNGEGLSPGFKLRLGARDMTLELRKDETRVLLDSLPSMPIGSDSSLFVKAENKITRINKEDISFVESQKDYIIFHTRDGQIRVLSRMKNIAQRLGGADFMRIHRSYLVRIDQIRTIEHEQVFLKDIPKPLPVGPSYKHNLIESLRLV